MRAGVDIIAGAVAITVGRIGLRGAAIPWVSRFFGSQVFIIGDSIAIKIGSTPTFSRAGFAGVFIQMVRDAIAICIRAALHFGQAVFIRAGILFIEHTIPICVARCGTTVMVSPAMFIRTKVIRIGYAIPIPIVGQGAAIGCWAGLIGAGIVLIHEAVAVIIIGVADLLGAGKNTRVVVIAVIPGRN